MSCQPDFVNKNDPWSSQTRSKGCTQKRTDPSRNIGGSGRIIIVFERIVFLETLHFLVMNTARYPEAVKIAYEKRLKSIYCA